MGITEEGVAYKIAKFLSVHHLALGLTLTIMGIAFFITARFLGTVNTDAAYWYSINKDIFRPWLFLAEPFFYISLPSIVIGPLLLFNARKKR